MTYQFQPAPPAVAESVGSLPFHGVRLRLPTAGHQRSEPAETAETRRGAAKYTHQPSAISNRPDGANG
jgi:hypothetical protein